MTNLVERLRKRSAVDSAHSLFISEDDRLMYEAADEIERLRHFVGSEDYRSDFQTAADMRAEIERLRGLLGAAQALDADVTYHFNPSPQLMDEEALSALLPDCMMPDGADPCEGYKKLMEERDALRNVAEAAKCIRHWHDAPNDGMVVSGEHVRKLWEAIGAWSEDD